MPLARLRSNRAGSGNPVAAQPHRMDSQLLVHSSHRSMPCFHRQWHLKSVKFYEKAVTMFYVLIPSSREAVRVVGVSAVPCAVVTKWVAVDSLQDLGQAVRGLSPPRCEPASVVAPTGQCDGATPPHQSEHRQPGS